MMVMNRAAGFIVYRGRVPNIEFLLLQSKSKSHHWTPPKGHVDPGETDLVTAYRETLEEAGIRKEQLRVVEAFCKTLEYRVKDANKTVVYWLAELINPNTDIILSDEHQNYKWSNLEESKTTAGFPDMQNLLVESHEYLLQT